VKIKPEWEFLEGCQARRMKVFGGWVFETWAYDNDKVIVADTVCFIPDPEHKWEIK